MHAWEALNQSTWLAGGSHNSLVAMTGGGLCYDITPDNLATGRIDAAVSAGFGKGAYGVGFGVRQDNNFLTLFLSLPHSGV